VQIDAVGVAFTCDDVAAVIEQGKGIAGL
jgi:hypothetical protein